MNLLFRGMSHHSVYSECFTLLWTFYQFTNMVKQIFYNLLISVVRKTIKPKDIYRDWSKIWPIMDILSHGIHMPALDSLYF
uniref:Uncharacterized protein n=1 Tax=Pyxicephalus adspersus TaxID=30357 RepID=A0AAV3AER8_PYXAD|nr:TPA: hypothetical protein GDO54_010478 [Pyxicephalus adspersus]